MGEEIRNKAFEDYRKGMKYKEIAEKYGGSLSAVKSWASQYWKRRLQPRHAGKGWTCSAYLRSLSVMDSGIGTRR